MVTLFLSVCLCQWGIGGWVYVLVCTGVGGVCSVASNTSSGLEGWWVGRSTLLSTLSECRLFDEPAGLHFITYRAPANFSTPDQVHCSPFFCYYVCYLCQVNAAIGTDNVFIRYVSVSLCVCMKIADTNHLDMLRCLRQMWQVRDKPVCVTLMQFSPLQCTGKVRDKFPTKSA